MKVLPMENSSDARRDSTVAAFGNSSTALVGSLILLASRPNAAGYHGLGDVSLSRGNREAAERGYQRALSLDPFDSRAHFRLATLSAAAHRTSNALREYKAGLLMNPTNSEAQAAVKPLHSQTPDEKP